MQSQQRPDTGPDNVGEKYFTVESANRALVLVGRIVRDITSAYTALLLERTERDRLSSAPGRAAEAAALNDTMERRVAQLEDLAGELRAIGCELKDWATGLVDFPAWLDGEPILLCWKLGEAEVQHWHGLNAGFAGRRPLDGVADRIADLPPAHTPAVS